MKYFYFLFSAIITTALFTNCAGNKDLQERPPAQFGGVYTMTDASSVQLFIPVKTLQTNRVSLDSVYFRGMSAPLEQDDLTPGMYSARFNTGKPDLIMSSDTREEYANKMPVKAGKSPFSLEEDEAILVFSQNNKTKYYKITGIREREAN